MTEIHLVGQHIPPAEEDATEKTGLVSRRPVVLTIAGFDPSSGAGVTADLKVFAASRLYGMACITALTVQSTQGVDRVEAIAAKVVRETLNKLAADVTLAGIKIGMLATADVAEVVAEFLTSVPRVPVVLDPVVKSSSGRNLIDSRGFEIIKTSLLPRASWVTPNLDELAALTKVPVVSREDVPAAAAELRTLAGNPGLNVLVTGGHLAETNDYLLNGAGQGYWIPGERIETNSTHGTGCALSSSLLCELVAGQAGVTAARRAKDYVAAALRAAYPVGKGHGPMNHFFAFEGSSAVDEA